MHGSESYCRAPLHQLLMGIMNIDKLGQMHQDLYADWHTL